ncbi:hypothetical protein [uncultured Parabacteroides sp.]|uniref:hypothetical protein n=1 Tax=uncultured Parabacteroides sp. TaxID=512312 RepID=UPI0028051E98|nr:hypothetical protein [uncultured Parabacteroides sp.]
MAIGAAIIGGLGSIVNSAIGASSQRRANIQNMELAKYQNNWQAVENEKAYARSLEMWNMQNAYNSPTAQMSRLRQAGLNPNLVYGSGVTGNSAGSAPQYQPAKIQRATMEPYRGWNLGLSDAVSTYLAVRQNKAQVENMEAQNKLIKEQARTEGIRQGNIAMSTARSGFDLNLARELRNISIDRAIAEKNLSEASAAGAWTGANQKVLQYELDRTLFDNKVKLSNAQYSTVMEGLRKLRQDNDINAFRNTMERVTGKSSLAEDLIRRLIMSIAPRELDNMFNPK